MRVSRKTTGQTTELLSEKAAAVRTGNFPATAGRNITEAVRGRKTDRHTVTGPHTAAGRDVTADPLTAGPPTADRDGTASPDTAGSRKETADLPSETVTPDRPEKASNTKSGQRTADPHRHRHSLSL